MAAAALKAPPGLPARAAPEPETDWFTLVKRLVLGLVWLAVLNGALFIYVARHWPAREETWERWQPLDTRIFLGLAVLGGSPVALSSFWTRDAGEQQEPLEQPMVGVIGLHVGVLIGLLWWWLAG